MNLTEFYLELAAQDITLWAEDGKVRYRAPKGAMTPAIVEKIKTRRDEILAWLEERAAGPGPVSAAQRGLWYLYQSAPQSPAYNLMFTMELTPGVDVARLSRAWAWLLDRHPILRTTYGMHERAGAPEVVAHLRHDLPTALQGLDVSAWSQPEIHHWIEEEADRPFDLAHGPVWRGHVLTGNPAANYLVLVIHHIAVDFVAVQQLFRELAQVYGALGRGEEPVLAPLPVDFSDYVRWEEAKLAAQAEELAGYWGQKMCAPLPVIDLPTDRARPPVQSYQGAIHEFEMDAALSAALRSLAQRNGVTPYVLVLAAFQIFLHRYSGQDDILIGTPMDVRGPAAFREVIGYYINSVVLRADLSGNPTFGELLQRVRGDVLGALQHQNYPFAQLVEQLHIQRDPSRSPLFQVSFVWDRFAVEPEEQANGEERLIQRAVTAGQRGAGDDLALSFYDSGQVGPQAQRGFWGSLTYNRELFQAETVERMARHFQTLLAAIVHSPDQPVGELSLLDPAERRQLLVEWNRTAADFPLHRTWHELFAEQAGRTPQRVAVVAADGASLTYAELEGKANQLAHHLRRLGVGPNCLVGIAVERSTEMVVGLLGILKAGGGYLPLDLSYPSERLQFMLDDARPSVLLTRDAQRADLSGLDLGSTPIVDLTGGWQAIGQEESTPPQAAAGPEDLAYVIYTSGSTGKPKGVMIPQRGLVNFSHAAIRQYGIQQSERALQFSTLNFDIAVEEIFPTLLTGARLVLRGPETVTAVGALLQLAEEQQVTLLNFPTAYWHEWVSEMERADLALPSALRAVITGGEKVSAQHFVRWHARTGNAITFFNGYGPTETTVTATVHRSGNGEDAALVGGELPIGTPIENTQAYILDGAMQPTPIGVPGELYIGGAGVALGYLNRPELTDERFVPDPFSQRPGARLYRTGDRVRYAPDGRILFLGRVDDQVKIRGFRVELGEIEAALTLHPQVEAAAVILYEPAQGSKRLAAFVVAPDRLDLTELRDWLGTRLPSYMIPASFALLPALPQLPNGKIDRAGLAGLEQKRASTEESAPRADVEESRTGVEASLLRIWSDILNLDEADISIHDNFFELGGDSILSIQIVSRALEAGITITPEQLFQNQTIAELSQIANTTARQIAQQGLVTGRLPLTPIQRWFFEQKLARPHHYNVALLFDTQPAVDADALREALAALLAHHDGLRLRFVHDQGAVWDAINAPLEDAVPFAVVDVGHLPPAQQAAAIEREASAAQASLNITKGPLIRMLLFLRGDSPPQLLIAVHHLAIDGLSWRVLLEDLETAYAQLRGGAPVRLPTKTTSFKEWAEQLAAAGPQAVADEWDYWDGLVQGGGGTIPVDHTTGHNSHGSAAVVTSALDREQTRSLLTDAPAAYRVRIDELLLVALAQLLADWTGENELLLHREGHGREELFAGVDLSRTVGWFTTIYPVRLTVGRPGDSLAVGDGETGGLDATIKSIKEQLRGIPRNGMGYSILRYLAAPAPQPVSGLGGNGSAPVTGLADSGPVDVSFNYLGQFRYSGGEGGLLADLAGGVIGSAHAPENNRSHLLEIDAMVEGGQLRILWGYSRNRHEQATIERLAAQYVEYLDRLVTHCLTNQSQAYTPSDFAGARVTQSQLDKLMTRIKKG